MKDAIVLAAKCGLGLLTMALLTSCGSTMNPNYGSAAEDLSTGASSTSSSTTDAECNLFSSTSGATLNGRVTDYYYNSVLQTDRIRLRLTGIDAVFTNDPTVSLQLYRWKADSAGNVTLDRTPLSFDFETGSGATSPFTNPMSSFSFSDVATMNSAAGINASTVQGFFADSTMVVMGLDSSWQALRVIMTQGLQPIAQVDVLLPIFPANPITYSQSHPIVLNQIHPFWNMRSQSGATDASWVALDQSYCF